MSDIDFGNIVNFIWKDNKFSCTQNSTGNRNQKRKEKMHEAKKLAFLKTLEGGIKQDNVAFHFVFQKYCFYAGKEVQERNWLQEKETRT